MDLFPSALDQLFAAKLKAKTQKDLLPNLFSWQMQALSQTLKWAYRQSLFYGRNLQGYNLEPKSLEDFAQLPLMTAKDLLSYEALLSTSKSLVERIVTLSTSGTTNQPKRLAFGSLDLAATEEFFAKGLSYLLRPGETLAVLLPGQNRPLGVVDLLIRALGANCHVVAHDWSKERGFHAEECALWLRQMAPDVLIAMPSQLELLLDVLPHGLPSLHGVLASAELLPEDLAVDLQKAWQCEVLNHYGLTESCYGLAVECPSHNGMHLRVTDFLIEIISLDEQKVLPAGEVGEIVLTTLTRKTMPLIRYRTGDVGYLVSEICKCGSVFPRLGQVLGRVEFNESGYDFISLPKGARG